MSTFDMYPSLRTVSASATSENAPDPYNEPFGDDSRLWAIYATNAKKVDDVYVSEWNRGLDTLALFSGLFSAVTSAFIIESYKLMQPDYTELTFRALSANNSDYSLEQPFVVSSIARAVNALWLASLVLSLSTALIAIMGKDWIAAYRVPDRPNLREWAQLRQFRWNSVRDWHMAEVIAFAPLILHISVMMFVAGLSAFIFQIDALTAVVVIACSTTTAIFYGIVSYSPLIWSSSPFRSPSTAALRNFLRSALSWLPTPRWSSMAGLRSSLKTLCQSAWNALISTPKSFHDSFTSIIQRFTLIGSLTLPDYWIDVPIPTSEAYNERLVAESILWLGETSPSHDVFLAVVHALKDAEIGRHVAVILNNRLDLWFIKGASLFNAGHVNLAVATRICLAGTNLLGGTNQSSLRPFMQRAHKFAKEPVSSWPEELLLVLCGPNAYPAPALIWKLGNLVDVHPATLHYLLEHIDDAGGWRTHNLLALLGSCTIHFLADDNLAALMVDMLLTDDNLRGGMHNLSRTHKIFEPVPDYAPTSSQHRLIEILCIALSRAQEMEIELDRAVMQSSLNALVLLCRSSSGYHISIPRLLGRTSKKHPIWTTRSWTIDAIDSLIQCVPSSETMNGAADPDEELDTDIANTLARFISPTQPWVISDNFAAVWKICELVRSIIPSDTHTPVERSRTYELLRVVFADAPLHTLRAGEWGYCKLLSSTATFLTNDSDFQSNDAKFLFDQLVGFSADSNQSSATRRCSMADSFPNIVWYLSGGFLELLDALVQLRCIFTDHKCWADIAHAAYMCSNRSPSPWDFEHAPTLIQFCADLGFVVPQYPDDIDDPLVPIAESLAHLPFYLDNYV